MVKTGLKDPTKKNLKTIPLDEDVKKGKAEEEKKKEPAGEELFPAQEREDSRAFEWLAVPAAALACLGYYSDWLAAAGLALAAVCLYRITVHRRKGIWLAVAAAACAVITIML